MMKICSWKDLGVEFEDFRFSFDFFYRSIRDF